MFGRRKPKAAPASEVLAEEIEKMDREEPGWDRSGRLAAARALLHSGYDPKGLEEIYGPEIVSRAQAELAKSDGEGSS